MTTLAPVPHDSDWRAQFLAEQRLIAAALNIAPACIHHVGSTAIPQIYAKPIIDILVEVEDVAALDARSAMRALGYRARGENGIPGRRYFTKHRSDGLRSHHVHCFERGSPGAIRHLAFRDYLRAHPERAQTYSKIKQEALEFGLLGDSYIGAKASFVEAAERDALAWYAAQR
ncbi:GrpB family protein [Qipengyuania flava]|uniref:GrpB family protein n=1 Tax=Qipengyuania flava TaxID=192812 RepID=UPI001C62FE3A|nr:GrpB family protein [Qipengyuania flava]QYJ06735.1 GrpB family protein [Qipengyuania flava]